MEAISQQIRYISQPIKIGNTHWRLVIKEYAAHSGLEEDGKRLCTEYQWNDEGRWQPGFKWPSYNINDTYLGMPRRLGTLYEREKETIELMIHGKPIAQRNLFE
ncbi:hypothetical protein [Runella aurantiaca]|uniref:Uncharacterized protein n=1 Tax=Runella aurantiaca TaxID=2282308 RepID=A0A369IKP7_9BACT|nr:hypothetical protein [Runella aurantiaca]RDB07814.1 hypothetical protein DVG78_01800 [Runella aurantiaca]